jgi:nitrogen-specific signal transduction histidine kinase
MQQHDSEITVRSDDSETAFEFLLPATDAPKKLPEAHLPGTAAVSAP